MMITAFALIALVAPLQQHSRRRSPADQPIDLCSTDPAASIRIDRKYGTTARYDLRGGPFTSRADAFTAAPGPEFRITLEIQTGSFSWFTIRADTPVRTAEQLRIQVGQLCALRRSSSAPLTLVSSADGAMRRSIARREARERKRNAAARARYLAAGKALERTFRMRLPFPDEIVAVVRRDWLEIKPSFGFQQSARLGRVRDAECRIVSDAIRCRVGVTAIVAGEPEYEQSDLEFTRDKDLQLQFVPDAIPSPIT